MNSAILFCPLGEGGLCWASTGQNAPERRQLGIQWPPPSSLSASCCQSACPDKAGLRAVWAGAPRENIIKKTLLPDRERGSTRGSYQGHKEDLKGMSSLL